MNLNSDNNEEQAASNEKSSLLPQATTSKSQNNPSKRKRSSTVTKRQRNQSFGLHSTQLLHAMNDNRSKSSQNASIIILLVSLLK